MKEKKIKLNVLITFLVFAAITVTIYALSGHIYGENSVFNKNISSNLFISKLYNKIPSLFKTIQIITISWAINWCLQTILHKALARTNRGTTIVKLINSFIKYFIVIIAIFLTLGAWGINTRTLIASAGILSLIIGLGAQSLIADIIAGIFIVFEGEYQVGDIVIIDGWRGTVEEIGIRSTRIIDWQGNVKIINNSEISTVINQSKELSVTTCVISISYGESIQKVELIIKDNLEKIRNAIPEIVEGPYYKGVDSLGESSVNLLFIAKVKESDYYVVQRALNRELKMIFDENGIVIPFPQVTINQPDNIDKSFNKKDANKANKFAEEQREVSKNLEDTNR